MEHQLRILVTGGSGFIGSAVVRQLLAEGHHVLNLDKLTYASNPRATRLDHPLYTFYQADICDPVAVEGVFARFRPHALMHLAAESHVDRSIDGPAEFLRTNIDGTFNLLQAALRYFRTLEADAAAAFRFHHVSTDEVYGDLAADAAPATEMNAYRPSSPYSASKAASDHLVRAWHRTYGLPVVVSNCSNNYGFWQFPEKLVPLMILSALGGRPLPVYGDGQQIRDWLFVDDHAEALRLVLMSGRIGEIYNIGGLSERANIEVVQELCRILEEEHPQKPLGTGRYSDLITYVTDRPGHDRRYAIDCGKIIGELGWRPTESFESGLRKTVRWYLDNLDWCADIRDRGYSGKRIGLEKVHAA